MARLGLPVLLVLLAVACCSKDPAPAPLANPGAITQTANTTAIGPTASATPTAPVPVFTADGAGPYLFGAKLSELQTAGLLDQVTNGPEVCDIAFAHGTGAYKDIWVTFSDGVLRGISNRSASVPTLAGARVGNTLAELRSIYGSTGEKLMREGTDDVAYLVTTASGRGIIFYFDRNDKVRSMVAGVAEYLKDDFDSPKDC